MLLKSYLILLSFKTLRLFLNAFQTKILLQYDELIVVGKNHQDQKQLTVQESIMARRWYQVAHWKTEIMKYKGS